MIVPIVSIGARTPVGYDASASAAAIRCALRPVKDHPFMVDRRGNPIRMGIDDGLIDRLMGAARLVVMARSALNEAMAPLDLAGVFRVDVILALPESRPGFTDAQAAWIANELVSGLLPVAADIGARGHAGGLDALRMAAQWVRDGRSELCAVVGVDGYIAAETIDWLGDADRIAGEGNRDGFVPGEGATCVVVASPSLGFSPLAVVRGAHSAIEARTIVSDEEPLGVGLAQAIEGATRSLKLPDEAVDFVICDLNGERYRTDEWGFALLRTSRVFRTSEYEMTSRCIGDVGAAHGALGCILAIRAWARGYAKGPRALVWGSSESGLRSAVLLEAHEG